VPCAIAHGTVALGRVISRALRHSADPASRKRVMTQ
jgi:hypothetical protein